MATGSLDANGIWQYGEDDSNTTFSALLNRLGTSIGSNMKGRIRQVVYGSTSTYVTNNTNSFVDGNLTATITPTSASSKILILINQFYGIASGGQIYNAVEFKTLRNGTQIGLHSGNGYTETSNYRWGFFMSQSILDAPATTSAITYKLQFRNQQTSSSCTTQPGGGPSTITLIEVSQ